MSAPTRLEIKLQEPNPLFTKWLERWLKNAEARQNKSQYKLREALQALRSYPLPLYSGQECAVLRGFGTTLCKLIDDELRLLRSGGSSFTTHIPEISRNNISYQQEVQQVVEKVKKAVEAKPTKKLTKKEREAQALAAERERQITMPAEMFRIKMIVDTQETNGKNKRVLDQTRSYLESLDIPNEIRRLTVGDFLWIAYNKDGDELVLPYIVERKRMDDLASSIRDGRFHEQKHRLNQCGIQHVIYLVEDYGDNEHLGLPLETLQQAIINTQIQSGFQIVHTENHFRTMQYLQCMTRTLIRLYSKKTLISTPKELLQTIEPHDKIVGLLKFRELYDDSARNAQVTVREVFVQQLLQLHSLSLDKALAIVEIYGTPRLLLDAYDACADVNEAKRLLAGIGVGPLHRPIGDKISQIIYEFYCTAF